MRKSYGAWDRFEVYPMLSPKMEVGPARKNNSNSGRQFYAPPSARLMLPQGCTAAAGAQGPGRRAGCGRARARSHTHTENICIHHELEQLVIANEAKQLQAQARGRAQLGSIRPPLLLQLPLQLQPQLQYRRWQAQFSSLRRQGRPINNGSGTRTKK